MVIVVLVLLALAFLIIGPAALFLVAALVGVLGIAHSVKSIGRDAGKIRETFRARGARLRGATGGARRESGDLALLATRGTWSPR